MVRIGIDARLLALPITGIGRYTWQLSRALSAGNGEFFLYMPAPPVLALEAAPDVQVRVAHVPGRLGRALWSQTILPHQAARDRLDLFWGTAHRLPPGLPSSVARVVTIHDLVWKFAPETMRTDSRLLERCLMPRAIRQADRVLVVSHSTAQAVEDAFPASRGKVRVVYPGTTAMSRPADKSSLLALGVDRPYFLFVGTLEPRKNLRRLLRAYARLPEAIRDSHLLVIAGGKGWGDVDVVQQAHELGLSRYVVVTGYVDDVQLATLYGHARLLAMPSLYEGFGLPLIEAMSLGVPVLTSNVSSLPEVAGEAGVLVDPFDVAAIAQGLSRLLTDDALHARLSRLATRVASRFCWSKAARETWEVFEEALAVRRARPGKSS